MIRSTDIHSVTEFSRHTKTYIQQVTQSKNPIAITINGTAQVVVQDAATYRGYRSNRGFQGCLRTGSAKQWLSAIEKAILSLESMPLRAALIPENSRFGFEYRHLIHQNHRIIFGVDEAANIVFVVRVYHGARSRLRGSALE